MWSAEADLVRELVRLRRGWGLYNRDLRARTGPQLVHRCGIGGTDSDREVRDKVRAWLDRVTADLPPELARAAFVALALDRTHQHRRFTERVESFAAERSWAPRTARRRMDDAFRLAAEAAAGRGTGDGAVEAGAEPALAAVLQLDATPPGYQDGRVVVLRVPVPRDRFDLVIRFERSEVPEVPA